MTVPTALSRADFPCNGATTVFPFTFPVAQIADITAFVTDSLGNETPLLNGSNCTIVLNGTSGGTLTTSSTYATGYTVTVKRLLAITQPTSIRNQGAFFPEIHEAVFDRLTEIDQQQQEQLDRAVILPDGVPDQGIFPVPVSGSVLGWVSGAWAWVSGASVTLATNLLTAAAGMGTSLVNYLAPYAGSVGRLLNAKLAETVSAADFGPYGLGDDTAALQAAINATPTGRTLTGNGLSYIVTTLQIPSNIVIENFNLQTKAGAVDYVAPITINGTSSAKSNIILRNIAVDGNRQNQTMIVGAAEDGGRHGFRILGNVSDLIIEDCSASYCAGDGIELFSNAVTSNDASLAFQRVVIRNFTGTYNRRHGMSGDSLQNVFLEDVVFNQNGLDLNTSDVLTHGNRGSRQVGSLYGNGTDFEGYGVGSGIDGLWIKGIKALANARGGMLFYDPSNPAATNFATRKRIFISDATLDAGGFPSDGSCLSFVPAVGKQSVPITASCATNVLTVTAVPGYPTSPILVGQTLIGAGVPLGVTILSQSGGTTGSTGTYNLSKTVGTIGSESMVVSNWQYQNVQVSQLQGSGTLIMKAVNNFKVDGACYTTAGATNCTIDTCSGFLDLAWTPNVMPMRTNIEQYTSLIVTPRMDSPSELPALPTVAYGGGQAGTFVSNSVSIFKDIGDGWLEYSAQFDFTPGGTAPSYNAQFAAPTGYTFKGFTLWGAAVAATAAPVKAYPADGTAKIYYDCPVTTIMNCACRFLVKKN